MAGTRMSCWAWTETISEVQQFWFEFASTYFYPAAMHIEHETGMDVWDGSCDQQRPPALFPQRVNAPGTSVPRAEQPDQIVSTSSPAAASSPPRISARQSARCGISGGRAACAGAGPGIAMAFCSSRSLISMRR